MSAGETTKSKRKILQLVITERCNLDCVYCYEQNKDVKRMPVEVALSAIENEFRQGDFDELEIDFHGGEPLLAFKEIQEICEWTWSKKWPKPYTFFATTNGILIRGKIREWFRHNRQRFCLGLSWDGTPAMQDQNRSNSSSAIDVDFFFQNWPSQPFKMTVSPLTLGDLSEGVFYMHNRGYSFTASFAYGVVWPDDSPMILERELALLNEYYLSNPNIVPVNLAVLPIEFIDRDDKYRKQCGVGSSMSCIGREGKKYPCHMFMPSSSGVEVEDLTALFSMFSGGMRLEKQCEECKLVQICQPCYGLSRARFGDMAVREPMHCAFTKSRARSSTWLCAQMLIRGREGYAHLRSRSNNDIRHLIEGIETMTREQ